MEEIAQQYSADPLFRWLTYGKYPVGEVRVAPKDTDLRVSREQITSIAVICKYVFPALLVIMGSILLLRRRRH